MSDNGNDGELVRQMSNDTTSIFRTTEEYFVRQDEFRCYIAEEVNPARVAHGLTEIRDDEARECFRILDKFFAQWRVLG